jgi:hypothetical protein
MATSLDPKLSVIRVLRTPQMRFRTLLALSALAAGALPALLDAPAIAAEAEAQKEELRTGGIGGTLRTKEENLATCMALWDPTTHMTKELWRSVCKRVETRN